MSEAPQPAKNNELATRYQRLFRDGKLIQIFISKWTMSARLSTSDLPLEAGAKLPDFVVLGEKRLIDPAQLKKFLALEQAARSYLRLHSLPFPISQAHFVPTKVLLNVLEKLEEYRNKFNALVEKFLTDYEEHKNTMLARYPSQREKLLPYYPPVDRVREKFSFVITMFEVAFPQQMRQIDLASVQAEEQARTVMQQKFEAEWQRQYTYNMGQIDTFLREAVLGARSKILEVFETIAEKIRNREIVSVTNIRTMTSVMDAFEQLDFMDDRIVRERLNSVRALLGQNPDLRSDHDAVAALNSAVSDVLSVVQNTTDVDALTGDYIRRMEI